MFLVAKALGKALNADIYTAEELEIVAKVWNKQLSQCENFIRQQQINELVAKKKQETDEIRVEEDCGTISDK